MTQMKSSIFPWIESSISPGDKARLQYLIVCLLRAVPQADRIALLNTATQAWQSKPSIKIERPPLRGSACGGNAAFLCARNTARRKSLRSAACLLITATCAANSSLNKRGIYFPGRRSADGVAQESSRCDGISIRDPRSCSVMATPLGHWFLWCSVMKQRWDINYVLTSRQTMTCDSFTTCYVDTVIQRATNSLTFARGSR